MTARAPLAIHAIVRDASHFGWATLTILSLAWHSPSHAERPLYEIARGANQLVCKAYREALVRAAPATRPWCGVDLNPSVEGFPVLRREYINDLDEAFVLKYRIQAFRGGQDQRYYENRFTIKDREGNRYWTEQEMKNNQLSMWRYEPRLDVDNDGQPDEVLGYRDNRCSSTRPIFNGLFIVDSKSLVIDEEKTRRLFGESRPYPVQTTTFIQLRAGQLGLFQYAGRNYIYSWGTDEAWTKRKKPPITSRVYLREGDKVSEVCEVRWNPERE